MSSPLSEEAAFRIIGDVVKRAVPNMSYPDMMREIVYRNVFDDLVQEDPLERHALIIRAFRAAEETPEAIERTVLAATREMRAQETKVPRPNPNRSCFGHTTYEYNYPEAEGYAANVVAQLKATGYL